MALLCAFALTVIAPPAPIDAVEPTSASVSATFVTSASASVPAPVMPPMLIATGVAVAVFVDVASMSIEAAVVVSPSNVVRVAPPTFAVGSSTVPVPRPPEAAFESAKEVLVDWAVTPTAPVTSIDALEPTLAVTSAPVWISASVPAPAKASVPPPTMFVTALVWFVPSAVTVSEPPETSPSIEAASAPPIVAVATRTPALMPTETLSRSSVEPAKLSASWPASTVIPPLTATLELEPIEAVLPAAPVISARPNAPVAPPRSDRLAR